MSMPGDTLNSKHTLPIGTTLNGKWVILEFIAKGGMGEIYRAHQLNLKRDVAIKVVSKEWLEDISEDPEEVENALKRFRQEVETMVQVRHPNVLQIYDYEKAVVEVEGKEREIEYIVLEYIPGKTLRGTMREEGFYPSEKETRQWINSYFLPLLEGVRAIHDIGIFHRDIKPENVLMDGEIPKIADFGLARSCRYESMTCSLEIKGTPNYMAPEQFIDFKRTDQRTDIYALGKILYEAVDGRIPPNAIPFKQASLRSPDTQFFKALDQIIQKATEEDIEKRYQSVDELKSAITEALAIPEEMGLTLGPKEKREPDHVERDFKRQKVLLYSVIGVLFAIIISAAISFYYLTYMHNGHHMALDQKDLFEGSSNETLSLPREIEGIDGVPLHLVPGGRIRLPAQFNNGVEKIVVVKPFYMDETPVTNHQYVNFLNSVLDKIKVSDGAVKHGDEIWLYLGEVLDGYEPIAFENGRFTIRHSAHSACPVVRVTAYGAMAYAKFYKKRLPTKAEWFFAALGGMKTPLKKGAPIVLPDLYYKKIELPFPVLMFRKNAYGLRGLNENMGEWVVISRDKSDLNDNTVIIGGFEKSALSKHLLPRPIPRKPWEAFEEVGFRCVMDIRNSNDHGNQLGESKKYESKRYGTEEGTTAPSGNKFFHVRDGDSYWHFE